MASITADSRFLSISYTITLTILLLATSVQELHATAKTLKVKRQLPLSTTCDPRTPKSCYKGDLIEEAIADCKRSPQFPPRTCQPRNDFMLSSVVDLPDVSKNGIDCIADTSRPIVCGSPGSDTRCVCDKAVDWRRLKETAFNQCRCQYWPERDIRKDRPSYCRQFDNGGKSRVHFYACCNNCNDARDSNCDGKDYQGGGSLGDYCGSCGENTPKGGGRETYAFNCVSCEQQSACEKKCNRQFFGWTAEVPGFCPMWAGCFRRCCIEAEEVLKADVMELLFDELD